MPDGLSAALGQIGWRRVLIGGKRILIVEDEFLVSAMLEDELLDRGGIVVGPAASLSEALRLVDVRWCRFSGQGVKLLPT